MIKKLGLMLVLVVIFWGGSPQAATYLWPLGAKRGISATFGEYREGHLHAGVDLKTWGREGYPVYAVAKGWVWRLKTSPWGYGKAIYLKLEDGRYAVYGHLSDFAPRIRMVVEREQEKRMRYSVEIFPSSGKIPVKRGEVIGYSGCTGKGPSHLHFELRDGKNHPINPLISGLRVKDNRAPVFKSVCIEPFSDSSSIDGFPKPKIYEFLRRGGIYRISGVPQIWGKIGLAIDVYDLIDGSENLCAVYGLELFLDGKLIFAKRYDTFSYLISHQVWLDWDLPLLLGGKGYFSRLYLLPGNSLPLYSPTGSRGFIEGLKPGYHKVKVLATDVAGNMSLLCFTVLVDLPPKLTKFQVSPQGVITLEGKDRDGVIKEVILESLQGKVWKTVARGGPNQILPLPQGEGGPLRAKAVDNWGVASPYHYLWPGEGRKVKGRSNFAVEPTPHWGYILLRIRLTQPYREEPHLYLSDHKIADLFPIDPQDYLASLPLMDSWKGKTEVKVKGADPQEVELDTTLWLWFVSASEGKRIATPGLRVDFPPQSIYQDMVVAIERSKADTPPLLPCLKGPCKIEPVDIPFDRKVEISVDIPAGADTLRAGLYSLQGNNWKWVRGSRRKGREITAGVWHFSTYAVLLDTIKPHIWGIKPPPGSRLRNKKPLLKARVKDQGSMIGSDENVRVWLDGKRIIAEWDPEKHSVQYRPRKPLSPGHHWLKILVRDRVGNQTIHRSEFWILR